MVPFVNPPRINQPEQSPLDSKASWTVCRSNRLPIFVVWVVIPPIANQIRFLLQRVFDSATLSFQPRYLISRLNQRQLGISEMTGQFGHLQFH